MASKKQTTPPEKTKKSIKKSEPGKRLLKLVKDFMPLKDFKKKYKEKKRGAFSTEKFNSMFQMTNKKGNVTELRIVAEILELNYDILLEIFEKPKEVAKITPLPIKSKEPKEKQEGIVLTIKNLEKGQPNPKAILVELPVKKSQLSLYQDGKEWRVELENEDLGLMLNLRLKEKEKEILRTSKKINLALIVE